MSAAGQDDADPKVLMERARQGNIAALAQLLERYRNYLAVLARRHVGSLLRVRLDPSDLVQETLLKAHQHFVGFVGESEAELVVWLRQILVRHLADEVKRHKATVRDVRREQSLEAALERSHSRVHEALAAEMSTPSVHMRSRERAVLVADALARLPAAYRQGLILRHLEANSYQDIAGRMNRSVGAVRMLWVRALEHLNALVKESD